MTPGSAPRPPSRRRADGGFSLMELLVVLGILALLAGFVGPRVVGYFARAKGQTAVTQIESLRAALDLFLLDTGRYPNPREGLGALVADPGNLPGWRGPYLAEALPVDPWGNPYRYRITREGRVEIASLGADAAEGGEGEAADILR